jgi:hypothetical protein
MLEEDLPESKALVHPGAAHRHWRQLDAREDVGARRQAILHRAVRAADVRALIAAFGQGDGRGGKRPGASRPISRRVIEQNAQTATD